MPRRQMSAPPDLPEDFRKKEHFRDLIRQHHQHTFARFLDNEHELLDNQTPRQAAQSKEGRAKLLNLLKITLYELDLRNQQSQTDLDINPILQELSFPELILK